MLLLKELSVDWEKHIQNEMSITEKAHHISRLTQVVEILNAENEVLKKVVNDFFIRRSELRQMALASIDIAIKNYDYILADVTLELINTIYDEHIFKGS